MHLIDKHMFPKDYDFYVVNDGIDRRSSMLRSGRHRRRSSAQHHLTEIEERNRKRASTLEIVNLDEEDKSQEEDAKSPGKADLPTPPSSQEDAEMEGLSGAMLALKFVPPSVRFGGRGRGKGRSGFSRT
jgi:hypothetical protein